MASILSDLIIPADEHSPSASQVRVVDFIDEWVSAPYPRQRRDRLTILDGLNWLNSEANERFSNNFVLLTSTQQVAICDDICFVPKAIPRFVAPAKFFACFRDLTAGGFYSTSEGRKDLSYIGNVPLARFEGPPPEVLKQAGLI